jgi:hypothetical protein
MERWSVFDGSKISSRVHSAEKTELWDRWERVESLKAEGLNASVEIGSITKLFKRAKGR